MRNTTTQFVIETYSKPYGPTRHGAAKAKPENDRFEKFIVDLAQRFTDSAEEAEAALNEMNADIERCSRTGTPQMTTESRLDAGIALRRLVRFLQ